MAPRKAGVVKKAAPAKKSRRPRRTDLPTITQSPRQAVVKAIPPRKRGTSTKYAEALEVARREVKVGVPFVLATFTSINGAAGIRRELLSGRKAVDGKVSDWEFTARRNDGGGSTLYATRVK